MKKKFTYRKLHSVGQAVGQAVKTVVVGIGKGHWHGRKSFPRSTHGGRQARVKGFGQYGRATALVTVGHGNGCLE